MKRHKKWLNIYLVSLLLIVQLFSLKALGIEKKYSFFIETTSNSGLYWAFIIDDRQHGSPGIKIKEVEYYADGILIKKITEKDAKLQQGKFKSYEFPLANPDKRTKLQPVTHKWIISTNQGLFTEERTLFIFEKYLGKDTFTEGEETEIKEELYSMLHERFKFRKEPSKQPPVVKIIPGSLGKPDGTELHIRTIHAIDNGRITKVEYYINDKLIQSYTGDLPHVFEVINPGKKPIGAELKVLFKVYDDEGNVTEVPGIGRVDKYTRTELHDEKWMYMRKGE